MKNYKKETMEADKNFPVCSNEEIAAEESFPQKVYDIVGELAAFFFEIDNKSEENKS